MREIVVDSSRVQSWKETRDSLISRPPLNKFSPFWIKTQLEKNILPDIPIYQAPNNFRTKKQH